MRARLLRRAGIALGVIGRFAGRFEFVDDDSHFPLLN
jgi:hypothetical protein